MDMDTTNTTTTEHDDLTTTPAEDRRRDRLDRWDAERYNQTVVYDRAWRRAARAAQEASDKARRLRREAAIIKKWARLATR